MKKLVALLLVIFVAAAGWSIGSRLSSDALGMSVGILLGVMAGLPVALLVLAAGRGGRREEEPDYPMDYGGGRGNPYGGYGQPQPPVIILAGPGMGQQQQPPGYPQGGYMAGGYPALPNPNAQMPPASGRRFKVVGEKEEWVDEWT